MREVVFAFGEPTVEIGFPGRGRHRPAQPAVEALRGWLATVEHGLAGARSPVNRVLREAVPDLPGAAT